MAFLNSFALWSGLAALGVAIPIVIHLLNRYRHKQVDWAAMELLRRALTIRSRQVRIEDILLMILRCLALALIAIALARPTIFGSSGKFLGGRQQVGVVIGLDASYSMGHKEVTSRFDKAKEQVRAIGKELKGATVTLVLMGESPRVLLNNVAYDEVAFNKVLADAQVKGERLGVDENLEQLRKLVAEMKGSSKECYLVTDGQALSWGNLSAGAKDTVTRIGKDARVFYVSATNNSAENVAVTRFDFVSGALRRGTTSRYLVEVKNFGRQPVGGVRVSLTANGVPADTRTIGQLPPGGSQVVPLFFRAEEGGAIRLKAELSPDALAMDNEAFAVANVRGQVRILCVDGEPSEMAYQGEVDYLTKALKPRATPATQSLTVERIPVGELPLRKLADFHVVMLANVGDVPAEALRPLKNFVESGGAVVIFLGDRIDGIDYNRKLNVDGVHLLPAELGEVLRTNPDNPQAFPIEAAAGGHPLSQVVRALPKELVNEGRVARFFNLKPTAGSQVVLNVAAGERFPLLIEKAVGRGKVLLFATSADREWNDVVVNPVYPILLSQMVTHLTEQAWERPFRVGQPLRVPLPVELATGTAAVRAPGGAEAVVNVAKQEGMPVVTYPATDAAGFYEIAPVKDAPPLLAAFNIDTAESEVGTLDDQALTSALSTLPVRRLGDGDDIGEVVRTTRQGRELWRVLLIAGLLILLLESFLAWWFSKRMNARVGVGPKSARDLLNAPGAAAA